MATHVYFNGSTFKPGKKCIHGAWTCELCPWTDGMSNQDYARLALGHGVIEGPLSGHRVVNVGPVHTIAPRPRPPPTLVPGPGALTMGPKPPSSAFRRVLSAIPELLLAWALVWLERLLPEDDD